MRWLWPDHLTSHGELPLTTKEETDTCKSLERHYHVHSAERNKSPEERRRPSKCSVSFQQSLMRSIVFLKV